MRGWVEIQKFVSLRNSLSMEWREVISLRTYIHNRVMKDTKSSKRRCFNSWNGGWEAAVITMHLTWNKFTLTSILQTISSTKRSISLLCHSNSSLGRSKISDQSSNYCKNFQRLWRKRGPKYVLLVKATSVKKSK